MLGHCACVATGLSSHAIARRFGHCQSGGTDHPHDPADLLRCLDYCERTSISTKALAKRMRAVSPEWAALVAEWDSLTFLLRAEQETKTGRAPATYTRMRKLIEAAVPVGVPRERRA